MIRVLQIVPSLNVVGGVENYIMNYYRHIDRTSIQFDFVYNIEEKDNKSFVDEIHSLGGKTFKLPELKAKNFFKISKQFDEILNKETYDIIHCHTANMAFIYLKKAKKHHIAIRILHSHQSKAADKKLHALRNYPLLFLGKKYATDFFACSELAGRFLFKNKKFEIINNAIDCDRFKFNPNERKSIREQYNIDENTVVLGNIGRFCNQKNQMFLLKLMKKLENVSPSKYKLMLIGDGELKNSLLNYIDSNHLEKSVILPGSMKDTSKIYSAFDLFLLPSLYEGLPVVGVEAQINGLRMICSTNVTEELNFSNLVSFLDLDLENWESYILNNFNYITRKNYIFPAFDICLQAKKLLNLYKGKLKR